MASVFGKSLLGIVASLVAASSIAAQDADQLFKEGIQLLRLNEREKSLEKFQEVLKLNPTHADAFRIWQQTESNIWWNLMAEGGEFEKIANYLLQHATLERKKASRDDAAIQALVAQATDHSLTHDKRRAAQLTLLKEHGEFAAPVLIEKLAVDHEHTPNLAILSLHTLGRHAVLPLTEALKSDNPVVRRNVIAALAQIGDNRAAAAIAQLAQNDAEESVREVAKRGMANLGVMAGKGAVEMHMAQAQECLARGIRDELQSDVVWQWQDGKLVAADTPSVLYPLEIAKKHAHAAMAIEPANTAAQALVARCYLAEATTIRDSLAAKPDDEALKAYGEKVDGLQLVAMAAGTNALRRAMSDSLEVGQVPVAVAAIHALGVAEERESLAASPLLAALDHDDTRVRYAAALAVSKASGTGEPPMLEKVVANLGGAVTEEAQRVIKVVDPNPEVRKSVVEAGAKQRGWPIEATATIHKAAEDILTYPNIDAVVINENQTDELPQTLIGIIKKHPRMAHTKILVVASDEEKAKATFGDRIHGVIKGPLTGEALMAAVNAALEGVDPGQHRARADAVAISASQALSDLAGRRANISGALANVAAQLNRQDAVAIPAAMAIGAGGSLANLDSLVAAIKGGGSTDLKVAAASAVGRILGRTNEVPAGLLDEMMAVVGSDTDPKLRAAAVTALGKGKLAPGDSLKLIEALKVGPGAGPAAPAAEKKPEN